MGKSTEVNAFEAKTHLSELLRETEQGRSFVIRRRGKPVAQLIPPAKNDTNPDFVQLLTQFKEIREKISETLRIRELIEEGRRY
ncbi:MAG: type II toxin-antitoxin system prevent-host-death family antitoxin [Nitrospira sp.]|nr:type II toxin-antitoxin system prevent-host-death family antitoxin [Candidatus Manganitrophaceae bacterium]HIL35648.1 type II toxin-antitoxin system prevent-host-death family antitoxin [Candidatus Manganitrophaceae bacterium]